ncbi:MAG: HDOD domain-containing protein [Magnetococcales bacterium]|nr:HDOD domain-containing protein [Magnetococcales bacterium]
MKLKKRILKKANALAKDLSIPSRPTVMMAFMRLQKSFAPDPNALIELIGQDLLMTATVLREANTVQMGIGPAVTSIREAVMLLGYPEVRELLTQLFLTTDLVGRDEPVQMLRKRAIRTAQVAFKLTKMLQETAPAFVSGYLPKISPEQAHTMGLLHEWGAIALMRAVPEYEKLYFKYVSKGSAALLNVERKDIGITHCQMGAYLAEQWQFPDWFQEVILLHHEPGYYIAPGRKLENLEPAARQGILTLAQRVCGLITDKEWKKIGPDAMRFFGLEESQFDQLMQTAANESSPSDLVN